MTNKPLITSQRAFSLIDLLIGIVVGSILLIGAYKAFISNVETNTMALDMASLDSKTRSLVRMMQADIEDTNGNQLKGLPTIFPIFDTSTGLGIKGFYLFKAEKRLPLFTSTGDMGDGIAQATWPENINLNQDAIKAVTSDFGGSGNSVPNLMALYNYRNYAWRIYKVGSTSDFNAGNRTFTLDFENWVQPAWETEPLYWAAFLITPPCVSFNTKPDSQMDSDADKVCTGGYYPKENNVIIILNVIRYQYDAATKTIYRMVNEVRETKSVIADNVTDFDISFPMQKSKIYQNHPYYEDMKIYKHSDVMNWIDHIIPDPDNPDNDDCATAFGYTCKGTTNPAYLGNRTPLAWGYFSSQISGINVNMKVTTAQERKQKRVNFLLTLDENRGSTAFDAIKPARIVASKPDDVSRPYASQISNPAIYRDPNDGSTNQPYYHAAAPMVSIPWKSEDPATYDHLESMCGYCNSNGTCVSGGYPTICSQNKTVGGTDLTKKDYLECRTLSESMKLYMGCGSPQGALNDSGLVAEDNRIDPKLVFLDNLSSVASTWNLSKNCGAGPECVLNTLYSSSIIGSYGPDLAPGEGQYSYNLNESWYDQLFPMTTFPDIDNNTIYIGVARNRYPTPSGTQNYLDKYYSTVFAFSGATPESPYPTSYQMITDAKAIAQSGSEPAASAKFDLDGVSQLVIRDENGGKYMYLSSHNSPSLGYRIKTGEGPGDWSEIAKAFDNKNDDGTDPTFNKKFVWMFQEAFPCSDTSDPGSCGGAERFTAIPTNDYSPSGPQWMAKKRIAHILAPTGLENDRIYFTEMIDTPDELIDGAAEQWFYKRTITYNKPIVHPDDGKTYACNPGSADAHCTIGPGPKPIDWNICMNGGDPAGIYGTGLGPHGNNCMLSYDDWTQWSTMFPNATDVLGDFTSALKVAFKNDDDDWVIKTIANIHDTSTSLLQDPITGDILIGGPHNIQILNIDYVNDIIVSASPTQPLDLSWKRPAIPNVPMPAGGTANVRQYTANNIVTSYLDPAVEGFDKLEFRKLSGVSLLPDATNLNLVFADMINRELGYIIKERDLDKRRIVALIVKSEAAQGGHDANLDDIAVYPKDGVSRSPEFAEWLLPYYSTKSYSDTHRKVDIGGELVAVFPIAGPIPLPPQNDIYKVDATTDGETLRQLSRNQQNCFADPNDSNVKQGTDTVCGQDPLYRECAGDVLSRMSIGLLGRQTSRYGCGLESPYATEDPFEPVAPPASSGGSSGGGSCGVKCNELGSTVVIGNIETPD